ncbi:unnamed protein product [Calypogeia fissa]
MVIRGGTRVARKRVEVGGMLMQEDNSNANWINKATGASREEEYRTSELPNLTSDRSFSPPLRTGDDFDVDSDEGLHSVTNGFEAFNHIGGGLNEEASTIAFDLDASYGATNERQDMEGVKEEVADSELARAERGSVAEDDGCDIFFDELRDLLPTLDVDKGPSTEEIMTTVSQAGPDLELASSSGFNQRVLESFTERFDAKDMVYLSPREQHQEGLRRIAQQMDADDDVLFLGPPSTQESSHSHFTTHDFLLPAAHHAPQSSTRGHDEANMLSLNFNGASRHSAPAVLQKGNDARENYLGSILHLSTVDNDLEEQMVYTNSSNCFEHALSLQPFTNIDRDRPRQNTGTVLASDVKDTGGIHTVHGMATPSSVGTVMQKYISSSKDNIISLSSSDSDSDRDSSIDEFEGPHYPVQSAAKQKRRAQDTWVVHSKKRPNIQVGSSQDVQWNTYDYKLLNSHSNQVPHQWNLPGSLQLPPRDCSGLYVDHFRSSGSGGIIQYSKSSVENNTNRAMQSIIPYDLNGKKMIQLPRTGPATAEAIMKDTLAGNNKEEELPPEGQLSVPLLKHQRVALAWMKKRELEGRIPGPDGKAGILQGGILADDQGLGKTISTISLILKERAPIKKTSSEVLCVDVLDDDDDSRVAGNANTVPSSISQKQDNSLSSDLSNSGTPTNAQTSQADVVAVSSKFRPAAGTLIVCPTSVLRQWATEIKEKVTEKAGLSVLIYHGSNRTKDPNELVKYDVVLTTYSIVSMEVPKQPLPEDKDNERKSSMGGENDESLPPTRMISKPKKPKKENGKTGRGNGKGRLVEGENGTVDSGPLARVNWFRVVLDEAQSIKNARTQGARAAWGLRSKRRWCLSGTPIQNAIDDLYSYFRFLRYSPFDSYKKFRELIKEPVTRTPTQGYANLLRLLTPVMLRRTKATKIDGQPIVNLPERIVKLKQAEFSDEERAFYNNLENESRKQFQDYAAAGTLQSNYVNILWMLLRLRQACDHPLLVKGQHHQSTQKVILDSAKKLSVEKRQHLLSLLEGNRDICPICSDIPDEAVVCVCTHIFCRQCIMEQLATGDDPCCPVPKCRKSLNTSLVFTLASLKSCEGGEGTSGQTLLLEGVLQTEGQSTEYVDWKSSSKIDAVISTLNALPRVSEVESKDELVAETSKGFEASKLEDAPVIPIAKQEPPFTVSLLESGPFLLPKGEEASASSESVRDGPSHETSVKNENVVTGQEIVVSKTGTVASSADKTGLQGAVSTALATKRKVLTEKAIVFSQWTSMLDLVEAKLKEENFNYRRLDGTMSVLQRDRAVFEFKTKPEVNVIIMSLKAASLGLNMVAACHVLLLDVWWNPTTEDQAIDRAHRIGQTRPVNVSRFTVRNTIEDRILELQEKKRHMVASAFGESQGGGNGRLSTAEMDYLFNGQDRPFI